VLSFESTVHKKLLGFTDSGQPIQLKIVCILLAVKEESLQQRLNLFLICLNLQTDDFSGSVT
jgi:hypothetical protein